MNRLIFGGCLVFAGLFLLLFIGAATKWTGVVVVICLAAIPLVIGFSLLRSHFHLEKQEALQRQTQIRGQHQKEVVRLAETRKGILTLTDIVAETSVGATEAADALNQLVVEGIAVMKVGSSGDLFYEFPEAIPPAESAHEEPRKVGGLRETVNRILGLKDSQEADGEYEKLRNDSAPEADAILMELLASGTVLHSPKASHALALKKAVVQLERMKQIRAQLPPIRGLADYRFYVDRDIKILEAIQKGASCHCDCYVGGGGYSSAYSPQRESNEGFVRILESTFENYEGRYVCECVHCGRKWVVLEDPMGYHYPVWQWTEKLE